MVVMNRHGWGHAAGVRAETHRYGVLYEDSLPMGSCSQSQSRRQFTLVHDPPSCSGSNVTAHVCMFPKRGFHHKDGSDSTAIASPSRPSSSRARVDQWRKLPGTARPRAASADSKKHDDEVMQHFLRWIVPRWRSVWVRFNRDGTMDWPCFEACVRYEMKYDASSTKRVFQLLDDGSGRIRNCKLLDARRRCESNFTMQHRGFEGLHRLLLGKFGNVTRAWRMEYDKDNTYGCCLSHFTRVCQKLGYSGNVKGLWTQLTGGDVDSLLRHQQLNPEADRLLARMAKVLHENDQTLREGWHAMMTSGSFLNRVSLPEFEKYFSNHGFSTRELRMMFECLAHGHNKSITNSDLHFFAQFEAGTSWVRWAASPGCCTSTPDIMWEQSEDARSIDLGELICVQDLLNLLGDSETGTIVLSSEEHEEYMQARNPEKACEHIAPHIRERIRDHLKKATMHGPVNNKLAELFRAIDDDESGSLEFEEIHNMFRNILGIPPSEVRDDDIRAFFDLLDDDGSGTVECEELLAFITASQVMPQRGFRQMYRPEKDDIHAVSGALKALRIAEEKQSAKDEEQESKRFQEPPFVVEKVDGKIQILSGKRGSNIKERTQMENLFKILDIDESGSLEFDELLVLSGKKETFEHKGKKGKKPVKFNVQKTVEQINLMDTSGDGLIDMDEFVEYFLSQLPDDEEACEQIIEELMANAKQGMEELEKEEARRRERREQSVKDMRAAKRRPWVQKKGKAKDLLEDEQFPEKPAPAKPPKKGDKKYNSTSTNAELSSLLRKVAMTAW